jgi:hypothetical protein
MAITTLDAVVEGMRPPENVIKNGVTTVAGRLYSLFYLAGAPGAAAVPSPGVAGAALTTYAGQIPFTNPASGDYSYLARLAAMSTENGTLLLCDRLWHNSGLDPTSTGAQTVNSAAWPARDKNGSINGDGVYIGLEVSTVLGAGTPTLTLGYTDQDGNAGASSVSAAIATTSAAGSFYPLPLAAGDTGVRSIQTLQQSATMTSGAYHLVAYRILATVGVHAGMENAIDVLSSGMPRLYDNTVPFLLFLPAGTTAPIITAQMTVTQG